MTATHVLSASSTSTGSTSAPSQRYASAPVARRLLLAGAVSAPLWAVSSLTQAATRDGFDITRHPLSALSNGSLGWLQIATFVVVGVLAVAGALGMRRALRGTPGGVWVPRLLLVNGIAMIAAGVFVMDPAAGFPVGTPEGTPESLSGASIGHMAAGSVAFFSLIAANYVLVRHFRRAGRAAEAVLSLIAGTALLLGNGWAMAGGTAGTLTLAVGALTPMLWVSAVSARASRGV